MKDDEGPVMEVLRRVAAMLQDLVDQQDEIIKTLTGSTREELKTAAELAKN